MGASNDATAQELIKSMRRRTGLSQAELARRAGLPRSVLCAYERGQRQPGVDALSRLARASGLRLALVRAREGPDPVEAARILSQVLDLAQSLPGRRRGRLEYPVLARRLGA